MKKILYIDMDNVLVDFPSAFEKIDSNTLEKYKDDLDEVPDIFSKMEPMSGAIEAYKELSELFDTYILSTAPWKNPIHQLGAISLFGCKSILANMLINGLF